ncbi:hypothetical protein [Mycobacterium sp.]|uniref:hypothetical protein n=1 Tax=Mycobacterium sp. TaxID=1785 RepID=UPI003A84D310
MNTKRKNYLLKKETVLKLEEIKKIKHISETKIIENLISEEYKIEKTTRDKNLTLKIYDSLKIIEKYLEGEDQEKFKKVKDEYYKNKFNKGVR